MQKPQLAKAKKQRDIAAGRRLTASLDRIQAEHRNAIDDRKGRLAVARASRHAATAKMLPLYLAAMRSVVADHVGVEGTAPNIIVSIEGVNAGFACRIGEFDRDCDYTHKVHQIVCAECGIAGSTLPSHESTLAMLQMISALTYHSPASSSRSIPSGRSGSSKVGVHAGPFPGSFRRMRNDALPQVPLRPRRDHPVARHATGDRGLGPCGRASPP
jgi:hypothetical protein